MDPITVTQLVQDRTQDLQRIADQVRQERSLRSTSAAAAEATPPAPVTEATPSAPVRTLEPHRAPVTPAAAASCDLAEPAA